MVLPGIDTVAPVIGGADAYMQLARFFVVFFLGIALTRIVLMPLISRLAGHRADSKRTIYSLENVAGVIGIFVSITAALQAAAFGDLLTVIGTVAAALTIAVGFGMREEVGNLVSGLFIQLDTPFVRDDYVVSGDDVEGRVKEVKLRETRLRSPGGEKVVVPNSRIANQPLHNRTRDRTTLDLLTVPVCAGSIDAAESLLQTIAAETAAIREDPAPEVTVTGIDPGTATLRFRYAIPDATNPERVRDHVFRRFMVEGADFVPEG